MKKNIFTVMLTLAISAAVVSAGGRADARTLGWRELYAALLKEKSAPETEYPDTADAFSLYDLNSDGVPELILSHGDYHGAYCTVYTVSGGELKKVLDLGSYGTCMYRTAGYLAGSYMGMGYTDINYYSIADDYKEYMSFSDNSGTAEREIYFTVNNKEVTKEEYEKELAGMQSGTGIELGRTYMINDDSIKYAVTGVKNYKAAYSGILKDSYLSSPYHNDDERYTLMDITGDRTPELIVYAGKMDIYTFTRGRAQLIATEYPDTQHGSITVGYSFDRKMLIVSSGTEDGKSADSCYSIRRGRIKCEGILSQNSTDKTYRIDENTVSKDEYEKAKKKYAGRRVYYGTVYDLNEENIKL